MRVRNTATIDGEVRYADAIVDVSPSQPGTGNLLVRFIPNETQPHVSTLAQPYIVIQVAHDYRYAVVATPDREKLWILSATPTISERDVVEVARKLSEEQGFTHKQIDSLVWTKRSA